MISLIPFEKKEINDEKTQLYNFMCGVVFCGVVEKSVFKIGVEDCMRYF